MKRFNTLGVMIDMSRNAVMNVDALKKYLALLADIGYNAAFLYTEDTYEIEGEDYFGYMRGKYSTKDLKDLDEFAFGIGVELIPCIQTLAHLKTISKWEKFPMDTPDILLADDEKTYALIEKMFKTLSRCFKSKKIHVGMDEAHMLGRGKHLDIHGYEPIDAIMKRHLGKVCNLANKYGFTPLIWSDMFFRPWNDGEYYIKRRSIPKEYAYALPENAIPVYWDYYFKDPAHYEDMFSNHEELSDRLWFAGGAWTWAGFSPMNAHSVENAIPAIDAAINHGVKDVFICMWGDNGAECSRYSIIPALFYISEYARGNRSDCDIKAKFKRKFGISYDDFSSLDLPNRVAMPSYAPDPIFNPAKYMLYSDYFCGFLDSTVRVGGGEIYASTAADFSKIASKSRKYGYLFDTAAKLCLLLADKYELGVKTRSAYKSGDKAELLHLAREEYTRVISSVVKFKKAFEKQWMRENKPYGFEVQEYRLGGLAERTRSCRKRLLDYASGKIDCIPELEEDILFFKDAGNSIYYNDFANTFTSNIM